MVLLVLTDTKIRYHYGKMANFVYPNQIQIQIGLVPLVQPDTLDDTSNLGCLHSPLMDGAIKIEANLSAQPADQKEIHLRSMRYKRWLIREVDKFVKML